jgi:hypothetical protein
MPTPKSAPKSGMKPKSSRNSSMRNSSMRNSSTRKKAPSDIVTEVVKIPREGDMRGISPPGVGWLYLKELVLRGGKTFDVWTRQKERGLSIPKPTMSIKKPPPTRAAVLDALADLFSKLSLNDKAEVTIPGAHSAAELKTELTEEAIDSMIDSKVGGRRQTRKLKRRKPRRPVPWWHF